VDEDKTGRKRLTCADKFGRVVKLGGGTVRCDHADPETLPHDVASAIRDTVSEGLHASDVEGLFSYVEELPSWSPGGLRKFCDDTVASADSASARATAIEVLTRLYDRRIDLGDKRRATVLQVLDDTLMRLFDSAPLFTELATRYWRRIDWATRQSLAAPERDEEHLLIDAQKFPPEGDDCDAVLLRRAYQLGWRKFIVYRLRGQRFTGVGLGPATDGVRIDVYGSSGDYLASGIDGLTLAVHGNAQDQVGQILKRGKLVIHGDVGQTFMYGAKGGEVYVLGNAAGRPLINAVGRPRVVINGTCLDFLAESFMAGDPTAGGGFVILNGVAFDAHGRLAALESPYPGSNLFSLASGGAIYIRDPERQVGERQLNGGAISELSDKDWRLIRPYLEENERLFGIAVEQLLTVGGEVREPEEVYRKVSAVKLQVLAGTTKK
jgi:glutamate synthase domain-containing protein 3